MTVNNEPRISQSLALLEAFRHTVADFAAREDELTRDIAKRRYATERKFQNALKDNSARLTREVAEADTLWKNRWEHVRHFHEARYVRLEKADLPVARHFEHGEKQVNAAERGWLLDEERRGIERAPIAD